MKKLKMIVMALFALAVTVGCSADNGEKEVQDTNQEVTAREVLNRIQEKMAEEYELTVINGVISDPESEGELYTIMDLTNEEDTEWFFMAEHFNLDDIKEGYILEPMMSMVRAELIIVVEAKDAEAAANVAAAMEKVKSDQEATWSTYLEDQYQLVRNNQIVTQGNFVLYVTSEHVDEIVTVFQEQVR